MPRIALSHVEESAPLSVAKLAERTGISTSTLRTWDRRYGLGPSSRTQGAHRRYSALDVARIEFVVDLVNRGVATADAAHEALQKTIADFQVDAQVEVSLEELINATINGQAHIVRSILDRSVARDGLMRSWSELLYPAGIQLMTRYEGETPGYSPLLTLSAKIMELLREMQDASPCTGCAKHVLLLADREHLIAANVLGVGLTHHDLDVKVLCAPSRHISAAARDFLTGCTPDVIAFVGASGHYLPLLKHLDEGESKLVVVSAEIDPCELPNAQFLHTLMAASEEIPAMVA